MKIIRLIIFIVLNWGLLYFYRWMMQNQIGLEVNDPMFSIVLWILTIPTILILAKWYFKQIKPSVKRGIQLGLWLAAAVLAADLILTEYVSGIISYVVYLEMFILCLYAGFEFDATFTSQRQ